MKKKIILVIIILLLSTLSIIKISYKKIKPIEEKKISIMIETDTGYEKSTSDSWPDMKKYEYDSKLSSCEKGSIEFDSEEGKIILKTKSIDKCKIYFYKLGTKEHPYKISTIEDLVDLSNDVKSGITYSGEYFILTKDLDFSNPDDYEDSTRTDYGDINGNSNNTEGLLKELTTERGFIPIGPDIDNSFQGTFDGNKKTISSLHITNNTGNIATAFFGYILNATIKDLTIDGEVYSDEKTSLAGIVSTSHDSEIIGCVNRAKVTLGIGNYQAAGVVSLAGGSTITDCQNYGNISNGNHTGGIVGIVNQGINVHETKIINSSNYGEVSNSLGSTAVGGIIGHQTDANSEMVTIDGCHNYGKISVDENPSAEQKVGGIMGIVRSSAVITNCTNEGEIVGHQTNANFNLNAGGIVGRVSGGEALIRDCHNTGDINGEYRMGGIIGHINSNGTAHVIDSSNKGTLTDVLTRVSSNCGSGGILGLGSSANIDVQNSYNEGTIHNFQAGGIIGHISGTSSITGTVNINGSWNTGEITASGTSIASAGGLIGISQYVNQTITGSYNEGKVTSTSHAGGLIGYIYGQNTIINNSRNGGEVSSKYIAGGIIGYVYKKINISDSWNSGKITANNNSDVYAGGIVGKLGNSSSLTINKCYNTGQIQGITVPNNNSPYQYTAGLVGESYDITFVLNSYNSGNISFDGTKGYVSGIGNSYRRLLTVINCYNSGTISGGLYTTGIASAMSSEPSLKIYNVYNRGTITGGTVNGIEYHPSGVTYEGNYTYDKPTTGQAFVNTLNSNLPKIDITSLKQELIENGLIDETYDLKLNRWQLGENNYPELIFD